MEKGSMPNKERDRLKAKEQRKNPGGILNNVWSQVYTGAPNSGCLVNILSIIMLVGFIFLVKSCSNS